MGGKIIEPERFERKKIEQEKANVAHGIIDLFKSYLSLYTDEELEQMDNESEKKYYALEEKYKDIIQTTPAFPIPQILHILPYMQKTVDKMKLYQEDYENFFAWYNEFSFLMDYHYNESVWKYEELNKELVTQCICSDPNYYPIDEVVDTFYQAVETIRINYPDDTDEKRKNILSALSIIFIKCRRSFWSHILDLHTMTYGY